MRAASCSSGSNDVRYCDGRRISLLVVVAVDKYWALAEGQSGYSRRTGGCLSLANVRQRRRQQPRTRKPLAHMTRTGDSHSVGPLSRATHQLRLFHDVYGWPPLLFSARRPVCRAPPPHDMKDERMAGQSDMSISKSISRSNWHFAALSDKIGPCS